MNPEEQLNQLSNDLEGYLNDFEAGITDKEDTISGLVDYVLKRVEISNNFKLNEIVRKLKGKIKKEIEVHCMEKNIVYMGALNEVIEIIKKQITKNK